MSRVNKNILQTVLFILIFGGLLIVASFFDLEISKILATDYLKAGTFYSTNPVGLIVEYIGSFPIFALGIFACLVFMHHIYNLKDNKKYFAIIFVIFFACSYLDSPISAISLQYFVIVPINCW